MLNDEIRGESIAAQELGFLKKPEEPDAHAQSEFRVLRIFPLARILKEHEGIKLHVRAAR